MCFFFLFLFLFSLGTFGLRIGDAVKKRRVVLLRADPDAKTLCKRMLKTAEAEDVCAG
jgi:hypothetical protein